MTLADIIKYILEGLAVAVAAYFIPQRSVSVIEIASIGFAAAATFMLLDLLSPMTAAGARQGAGFGIGLNQVGWQAGGKNEVGGCNGEEDDEEEDDEDEE